MEVDIDEKELVGYLDAPTKDTNTIVKVVAGEDVTTPSELKENKSSSQVPVGDYDHPEYPAWSARVRASQENKNKFKWVIRISVKLQRRLKKPN